MRIIGPHPTRDYYDTAGWSDHEVFFSRSPKDRAEVLRFQAPFSWPDLLSGPRDADGSRIVGRFGMVLMGGEAYPFLRTFRERLRTPASHDIIRAPLEIGYAAEEVEQIIRRNRLTPYGYFRDSGADRTSFMRTSRDVLMGWCLDNGVITGVAERKTPKLWGEEDTLSQAQINTAGLDEMEFYKAVDPATAHMRIEGFISGVLGSTRETGEIPDEDKIRKAGFDTQSFRTRPGTRKPRKTRRGD